MSFEVHFTIAAQEDIGEAFDYIDGDSPSAANSWLHNLVDRCNGLADTPLLGDVIPEAEELQFPYRSFNHHSHRIIYRVDERYQRIYVVRVYHGARRPLTRRDIPKR